MSVLSEIRNSGILDIDNNIDIDKAVFKTRSKKLIIDFVLDKGIPLKKYKMLQVKVKEIFTNLKDVDLDFSFGYKNEDLSEEELREYLKEILTVLYNNSGKYRALEVEKAKIEGNHITFLVAVDALGLNDLSEPIENEFANYGYSVVVEIEKDEKVSIESEVKRLDTELKEELKRQAMENKASSEFNNKVQELKKYYKKEAPKVKTSINKVPLNHEELIQYQNEHGIDEVMIEGYIFGCEIRTFPNGKSSLMTLKVTDDTDSILVKKWLRGESETELYSGQMKNDTMVRIIGKIEYDTYARTILITASSIEVIGVHKEELIEDTAPVKRVELHAHSKMTNLDGLVEPLDYIKTASKWGWKAIAITDTSGVYGVADIDHGISKFPDLKPIYGTEMPFINDEKYFITFNNSEFDCNLKDAVYTVYDIETTGLSQTYSRIIQIAACKVKNGMIVDRFNEFVNPEMLIPEKITSLTSITNEMVSDKDRIDVVLPRFLEYAKDTILVAHNAKFDVGFIYSEIKRLGIDYPKLGAIDTLMLFRSVHPELKKFNLKVVAKQYKVKQEQHHIADDDARVLAEAFIEMLKELYDRNINTFKEINTLIDPNTMYKQLFPSYITILAKNPKGYKNMLKIVSDALTYHLASDARLLKSVLDKYREGILVGSGSSNGNVFEYALNRSVEEMEEEMAYFDYVEVLPPSGYLQYYSELPNGKDDVIEVINKIMASAKKLGKMVVAVSDSHYLRPNEKKYRDILIQAPQIGGGVHPLKDYKESPQSHLRTTDEMLKEFDFLDKDLAYEIVVANTNLIADQIEKYPAFHEEMFAPADDEFKDCFLHVPSIVEEVKRICNEHLKDAYGDNPSGIVTDRLNHELSCIIASGYASVYYMSYLMVAKSLSDGYLVGSRGSVGSSFVATMMDITEVNPLKPHYRCKKCKWHTFKMSNEEVEKYGRRDDELPFVEILNEAQSGYNLPDAKCPCCGENLYKDGHDIPFETFLGFKGDKTPDIDLNFSGEYQPQAHEYIRTVFGKENAFRAGTVATIADKNAYGYIKGYLERTNTTLREVEIERLSTHLIGVKRSTGQHPGGIVVVPHRVDIYDVTPVQYPANDGESVWRTTHYDYHKFENNLLKLDVLGHDDPTLIRYLMNYVNAHQSEFPFTRAQDIPVDDPKIYKLFNGTDVIGVTPEELGCKVASYGVPEFGTPFVQGMLVDTRPQTFAELVKISGLSHGTNVWNTNAQDLVTGKTEFGVIPFKDVIGCRDDIMVDLIAMGVDPLKSFKIMEFVRKNKKKGDPQGWLDWQKVMRESNVPEWYIWSCGRIEYMFPKAHATAYVLMALRIAWFKVNYPVLFYSAWLSKRAKGHDVKAYLGGPVAIRAKIQEIKSNKNATAKDDDLVTSLQIALEMTLRKIKFLPVDIHKSDATVFTVEDGNLRIPFNAVDKLGDSVAETIVKAREEKDFDSIDDVMERTKLNKSLCEEFKIMHFFSDLGEKEAEIEKKEQEAENLGIFAFQE